MALEFRVPAEEELRTTLAAADAASGLELRDDDFEVARPQVSVDRTIGAYDGGRAIGVATSLDFELTVPGGQLPMAGVTWVGVLPTHRRRGVLRELMRLQLEDLRRRGEPLAGLWASESLIYGRFGYGLSVPV